MSCEWRLNSSQEESAPKDKRGEGTTLMKEQVRIGVVGAGWFASRRHLPEIGRCARATLAAVCRRDPLELQRIVEHFGQPPAYTDYGRMLEEAELDAVLICTPHALHGPQAAAALERGLHVLVEKPLALTAVEAEALAAQAKASGLVLAVAVNPPYWAHCHALRTWLAAGHMGELELVDLRWLGSVEALYGRSPLPETLPGVVRPSLFRGDPALAGGGHLMDAGAHLVSELLWVTGRQPVAVAALMDDPANDLRACVSLQLDNGAMATITVRGDSRHPSRRVCSRYYGSAGMAEVDGMPFRLTLSPHCESSQVHAEAELPAAPTPVENFVEAIQGRAELLSPPEHGIALARTMEAAYQSARTGQTVQLAG
jgi:predicted dehydrogenase